MAEIFRKKNIDKLSNPEQLDRMIVITSPSFWIAMLGVLLIVIVTLFWSIFGYIAVKVETGGIYISNNGISAVYSQVEGVVDEVLVKDGDTVIEGQVLMTVSNESISQEIESLQERLNTVNAITTTSKNDLVTADNREMVDIKNQLATLQNNLETIEAAYENKEAELEDQKSDTTYYKNILDSKEREYLNSVAAQSYNSAQINYMNSQSQYEQSKVSTEIAKQSLDTAKDQYLMAVATIYVPKDDTEIMSPSELGLENDQTIVSFWSNYQANFNNYDAAVKAENSAKEIVDKMAEILNNTPVSSSNQLDTEVIGIEYQIAQSDYQSSQSIEMNLQAELDSLSQQIESEKSNISTQEESLLAQFNSAKSSITVQLETEIEKYQSNVDDLQIVASSEGVVTGVQVQTGNLISAGTQLVNINNDNAMENIVICYVPLSEGKKITAGMEAMVSPSTVNDQEYGFIEANVLSVSSYTVSSNEMLARLGDQVLVESFLQNGPVVEITCELKKDESTLSGYSWSSDKGKDVEITEGTIMNTSIITEKKTPISMLIPFLKEKLTINPSEEG